MNTHLDFIHPNYKLCQNFTKRDMHDKYFSIGDRVSVKNYNGKDKRALGRVKSKVGVLQYEIKLDNNDIVRRHVHQIIKIGENTPLNFESIKYYPPPPNVQSEISNGVNSSVEEENKTYIDTNQNTLRRSKRTKKAVVRLNYNK